MGPERTPALGLEQPARERSNRNYSIPPFSLRALNLAFINRRLQLERAGFQIRCPPPHGERSSYPNTGQCGQCHHGLEWFPELSHRAWYVLSGHMDGQLFDFIQRSGRPGPLCLLPSYFMAISFRCQANSVSGMTMLVDSRSTRRQSFVALTVKHWRRSSLRCNRLFPSCSHSEPFFFGTYSTAYCCCWFIHPARKINRRRKISRDIQGQGH